MLNQFDYVADNYEVYIYLKLKILKIENKPEIKSNYL